MLCPSQTFTSQTPPISRKAKIMHKIIRLVVDLHVNQVSEKKIIDGCFWEANVRAGLQCPRRVKHSRSYMFILLGKDILFIFPLFIHSYHAHNLPPSQSDFILMFLTQNPENASPKLTLSIPLLLDSAKKSCTFLTPKVHLYNLFNKSIIPGIIQNYFMSRDM